MPESPPLLELQRLDAAADVLRARREALPERALLRDGESERAAIEVRQREVADRRAVLGREERRVEQEVEDARAKAHEIETSLYSGKVKVVKELEGLQMELALFQSRQREHEEAELALMEEEEQLSEQCTALAARAVSLAAEVGKWQAALGAAEAEIDAELTRLARERAAVVAQIPAAAAATYEKLRSMPRLKGRVVARIEGETCNGCWGGVPIAFATRFAQQAADITTECPRCGRILVH